MMDFILFTPSMCTADACRDVLPAERLQISGQNTGAWTFSRTLQQHNVPHTKKKKKTEREENVGSTSFATYELFPIWLHFLAVSSPRSEELDKCL